MKSISCPKYSSCWKICVCLTCMRYSSHKIQNSTLLTRSLFHLLYSITRPLVSIFFHVPPPWNEVVEIVRPIRVLTLQARVLKYLVIRLVWELSSTRGLTLPIYSLDAGYRFLIRPSRKLQYAWKSFRNTVSLHCKFENLHLAPDWKLRKRSSGAAFEWWNFPIHEQSLCKIYLTRCGVRIYTFRHFAVRFKINTFLPSNTRTKMSMILQHIYQATKLILPSVKRINVLATKYAWYEINN